MINPEEIFEKLVNNQITREEFEHLLEGLDNAEIRAKYDQYLKLKFEEALTSHFTDLHDEPDYVAEFPGFQRPQPVKQIFKERKTKRNRFSVAAVMLILIGLTFSILFAITQFNINTKAQEVRREIGPQILTKSTPNKRMFRMRLEDGSFVHLNAVSSISYPQEFDDKNREIEILGEAYFDIERDEARPFKIKVKDYSVQVLGTSFNIKAYDDEEDFSVTVESGTVKVLLNQDDLEPVILTKGQKLVFSAETNEINVATVNSENELSWRKGIFRFNETPMSEVEKMIERWYGVDLIIEDQNIYNKTWSGAHQNDNLISVMEALTYSTKTNYLIKDNSIIIKN
jgi:ferric-dicitrate binding protein FerR (iron transport regulator)